MEITMLRTILVMLICCGASYTAAQVPNPGELAQRQLDIQDSWNNAKKLGLSQKLVDKPRSDRECLQGPLRTGQKGYLETWQLAVRQVIGEKDLLIGFDDFSGEPLWLTGYPSKGLVDGDTIRLIGLIEVAGTKSFETVAGSKKTVRLIRFVEPEEADPFLEWVSANGKHKVLAKFVDFTDGKVVLLTKKGKRVEVKPSDLSSVSQRAYREILKERREAEKQKKKAKRG
jgi:hypothetical protein